jgi:O-antigen/teichoic acid export membrane protein
MNKRRVLFSIAALVSLAAALLTGTLALQSAWLSAFSAANIDKLRILFWTYCVCAVIATLLAVWLGLKASEKQRDTATSS